MSVDTRDVDRGVVPVVGAVALLAVTACLGAVAGSIALAATPGDRADPGPTVALSLSVANDRVSVTHRGGTVIDAREVGLRVTVNGTPLAEQPPVPFFAASGFRAGPTGPFNAAADPRWGAGETASFRVAGTNAPTLAPEARVAVRVSAAGRPIASLSATARRA